MTTEKTAFTKKPSSTDVANSNPSSLSNPKTAREKSRASGLSPKASTKTTTKSPMISSSKYSQKMRCTASIFWSYPSRIPPDPLKSSKKRSRGLRTPRSLFLLRVNQLTYLHCHTKFHLVLLRDQGTKNVPFPARLIS